MFFDNAMFKERNLQLINARSLCNFVVPPVTFMSILKTGAKIIHKFYFAMDKIITPFFLDL